MEAAIARLFDLSRGGDTAERTVYSDASRPSCTRRDGEGCTAPMLLLQQAPLMWLSCSFRQVLAFVMSIRIVGKPYITRAPTGISAWPLPCRMALCSLRLLKWMAAYSCGCSPGQTQLARLLAAQGADLYAATQKGEGAIHLATEAGAVGIRPMAIARHGWEAARITDDDGGSPSQRSSPGNLPLLRLFANETPDHVMATSDGCTPLHLAANAGNVAEVKWLLKKGADASAVTSDGLTAEYLAALSGHVELLDLVSLRASGTAVDDQPLPSRRVQQARSLSRAHARNPAKVASLTRDLGRAPKRCRPQPCRSARCR